VIRGFSSRRLDSHHLRDIGHGANALSTHSFTLAFTKGGLRCHRRGNGHGQSLLNAVSVFHQVVLSDRCRGIEKRESMPDRDQADGVFGPENSVEFGPWKKTDVPDCRWWPVACLLALELAVSACDRAGQRPGRNTSLKPQGQCDQLPRSMEHFFAAMASVPACGRQPLPPDHPTRMVCYVTRLTGPKKIAAALKMPSSADAVARPGRTGAPMIGRSRPSAASQIYLEAIFLRGCRERRGPVLMSVLRSGLESFRVL